MSLDGKTGSNLVNLDGKSDSNSITLLSGINISVIENPTDTYTINAIASGAVYSNTDNNLVIDSDTINLSTTINVSNISADLITSNSVVIGNLDNKAIFSNKLFFNNSSYAFGQSQTGITLINSATDRIWVLKNMSMWGDLDSSGNINASSLNTSSLIIPDDTIKKTKIINLNTSLDSLSNYIGSLNTSVSGLSGDITTLNSNVSNMSNDIVTLKSNVSNMSNDIVTLKSNVSGLSGDIATLNSNVSNLSNNKQDNITLIAGANISISKQNSSWTIESLASGGSQYSNIDNNLVIDNVSDTINLSTTINVSNISADIITAGVTRIRSGNISDALFINSCVDNNNTNYAAIRQLSSGKTIINSYGSDLTLRKTEFVTTNGKSTRTIGDLNWNGSTLVGNKLKFTEVEVNTTLTIPTNSITQDKISGLNTSLGNISNDIGTLNTNVSNLSSNVANLNTSVSDLGNIETIARDWAQSSSPPDPNDATSKSSKTWASRSEEWAQSDGTPGGLGTLSAAGWAAAAGTAAGTATGAATAAGLSQTAAGQSATNAGTAAFDAGNSESNAAGYRDKAKDWAQSGLSPDPNNADAKSSKTWSIESKNWAQSTSEPGGQDTKSSKSWAGKSEEFRNSARAWAQSDDEPGGTNSNTKSAKSWADIAYDWAESTTAPGGGTTQSAKSWAGDCVSYRDAAQAWAESTTAPAGGTTQSAKSWAGECVSYRDAAQAWAESTTAPGGGTTKSAKTIVNDFQNSLDSEIIVSAVKIGFLNGSPTGGADQATFMNSTQIFPGIDPNTQIQKYCLMQDRLGYSYLNSPQEVWMRIKNVNKIILEDNKCTFTVPLLIDSVNVGTTLGNHGSAISTIQGDISNINTDISSLDNNKQNNITINGGTNVTVSKNSNTWTINSANITLVGGTNVTVSQDNNTWTINSSGSNLLGTNNISISNNSIDLSSNISTDNCSLKNLSADLITSTWTKIGSLENKAVFSHKNYFNNSNYAFGQSQTGITLINSASNRIWIYKNTSMFGDLDVSYNINSSTLNTSSINASDASFNNLTIDTINNISATNLIVSFKDPDGIDVKSNNEVTIPFDISFFYPDTTDAVNELNGLKYVEVPYNIFFENSQGNNVVVFDPVTEKRTVIIPESNIGGTNNISVRNGSINLSTNISTNNCSLLNLSVNNLLNVNTLKMGTIVTGIIGQDNIACIAQQNYFNNTGYALGQTTGGQTLINSNTSVIKAIKNMEIDGDLNVSNIITKINGNINTSYLVAFEGNISNLDTNETSALTIYCRYLNVSNSNVLNTNTSNLNASNISVRQAYCETTLTTADINVSNINSSIITTGDINVDDIAVIENGRFRMKAGSNYGELKAYSTKFNISCSNALYLSLAHHNKERINIYSNNIDLNTDTNISGKLNVSEISTSSIATDLVTASSIVTVNMSADNMSGSNMSIINDLSVGGVLTAPNINLTGLNTLVIGNALMGYLEGNIAYAYAVFCHKDNNTGNDYALLQGNTNTDKNTYLNCRDGGGIYFRTNNNDRMNLYTLNNYTCLDLIHPSSSGNTRLQFFKGNGDNWGILNLPDSNYLIFRWNGEDKFNVNSNGDIEAKRDSYGRNLVASGQLYTNNAFVGVSAYGTSYATFTKRGFETTGGQYALLHDTGANTYVNGLSYLYLRINNQNILYLTSGGVYNSNGNRVHSDDRLKYEEEDILGLNIIRQLKPKKYKKIKLPFVKKRRRYYDENDITIIDDYIEDVSMNEINEINQSRKDISMNDLSFNEYYDDDDYIHKEIIEEEDVDEFVSEKDISNGQIEVGLIAQDLLETDISFVVHKQEIPEDMNGKPLFQPYAVDYGSVMPYCIQAIKDLDVIVQGLKDKINNLEAENNILEARVHELENV